METITTLGTAVTKYLYITTKSKTARLIKSNDFGKEYYE